MAGVYPLDSGMGGQVKGTQPLFAMAAQTVAEVSGLTETAAALIHGKALRHYAEGLRQYLAIRLGSTGEGNRALGELRALVGASSPTDLTQPPGIRARLFKLAREIAARRREELGSAELRSGSPGGAALDLETA